MGTNNRQRRAAKSRKRERRAQRPTGQPWPPFDPLDPTADVGPMPRAGFDGRVASRSRTVAANLLAVTESILDNGWEPVELVRQLRRAVSSQAADLMAIVVAVDDDRRGGPVRHPLWQIQIDRLRRGVAPRELGDGWLESWLGEHEPDGNDIVEKVLTELTSLRALHRLIPPPGQTETDGCAPDLDDASDPALARVRALLAQAESTTFPAEAEAFTAKAQALMSRHSIDEAIIRAASGENGRPVTVRLPIDDPYVSEKANLLHAVADASRCVSIHLTHYAMSTVTGAAADVRRVELLFTSLLVQSQAALNHESAHDSSGSYRRSRAFRAAFLAGYASRIGERLAAERDRAANAAGGGVLPVLARQSQAVADEVERLFGDSVVAGRGKRRDRAGWSAGSDAADRARLTGSDLAPGTGATAIRR